MKEYEFTPKDKEYTTLVFKTDILDKCKKAFVEGTFKELKWTYKISRKKNER